NVYFIRTNIWLNGHISDKLLPDVLNSYRLGFFMCDIYNIRMIPVHSLFTGTALQTGLFPMFFTLQCHSKYLCQKLLAASFFPGKNIGMGNLICSRSVLQMFDHFFMS